jgi:hypothetical protein
VLWAGEDTTFRLIEVRTGVTPVDRPPTGPSIGDEVVLAGQLRTGQMQRRLVSRMMSARLSPQAARRLRCSRVIKLTAGTTGPAGERTRETDLDGIPDAYVAMDQRRAIKALIRVETI